MTRDTRPSRDAESGSPGSRTSYYHGPSASSPPGEQPLTLSIPEACQLLGVGETTLRQMIRSRQLPILKIGRRVLIPRQAVELLVASACPTEAGPALLPGRR